MRPKFRLRDVVSILGTTAIVFVARASFADHYTVPSGSMEPTVSIGDQICVNKAAYGLRIPASQEYILRAGGPNRGDVVVLSSPADGEVLLKRVVALSGDVVTVRQGRVSIEGAEIPLRENASGTLETIGEHTHPLGTTFGGGPDFGPVRVPLDRYLVLGDNRGNSRDGRFFGWVDRDAILGRAVAICAHDGRPVWHRL